jgi:hypothetical protein
MDEIEKKVNAMIGESTMNEYKDYKNLVKHKRRINRVFTKVCGENSFRSHRPEIEKKAPAVAWLVAQPRLSRPPEENLRRKEREA